MNNEKQPDLEQVLGFLSPRLVELLRRLTKHNRRGNLLQEIAVLIEERAYGQVQRVADRDVIPLVDVTNLPEIRFVEKVRVRRVPPQAVDADPPLHDADISSGPTDR